MLSAIAAYERALVSFDSPFDYFIAGDARDERAEPYRVKTPGLRNVLVTEPYFHDGSMQTLWDVMDHYNKGDGITPPWLDKDMQRLTLTEPEIDDMVAFLASLTIREYKAIGGQEYARQLALPK
jgi:cytochrome c peroxidase